MNDVMEQLAVFIFWFIVAGLVLYLGFEVYDWARRFFRGF